MRIFKSSKQIILLCIYVLLSINAYTKAPFVPPTTITGFGPYSDFNGHRYFKSMDVVTWKDAARIADSLGGNLVIINNSDENTFVKNFLNTDSWIGNTDQATENTWLDVLGNASVYTNWSSGEPNNTGSNEHYAAMIKNTGLWNDDINTNLKAYVIEFNGVETSNWTLISTITKSFNANWNETLAATNSSKQYKLVVNGTWGIANGIQHRDAAYETFSNTNIDNVSANPWANRACADGNNWYFNGACPPLIPSYPGGYASDHIYEYLIGPGKSGGYPISFTDGALGDNSGSLTFKLYESSTPLTSSIVTAPDQLTLTTGVSSNTITWTSYSTNKVRQFNVYRSEDNGVTYTIIGKTTITSFEDNTIQPSKKYKYKVSEIRKHATNNVLSAGQLNDFSFDNSSNDTYSRLISGTNTNVTQTTDRFGVNNSAYQFNGTSYISYPNTVANVTSSNVHSISLWFNQTPSTTGNNLISKYYNLDASLSQFNIGTAQVIGNGTNALNYTAPASGWQHYLIVFKDGTGNTKVYKNGALFSSGTLNYNSATRATNFFVGRISAGGSFGEFNGKIDDIKVYNRELSATEVSSLYTIENTVNTSTESSFTNTVSNVLPNRIVYVNKVAGSNSNTGTIGSPYSTIQYAINNASDGDTIIISDHTYTESLSISQAFAKLTIASTFIMDKDSAHTKAAIIDGTNTSWSNIHINSSSNLVFKGITFKNTKGRLLTAPGKNIQFVGCQISNLGFNSSNITANAIIASSVLIDSSLVFNNNYIQGIVTADSVSFTNSKFYGNFGALVSNNGGGSSSAAYIFNSLVLNNARLQNSNTMGDYFIHNVARQHVIRNKFSGNNYMNVLGGSNLSYQKVINNLFHKTSGAAIGRTVNVTNRDSLILIHNTFIDNSTDLTAHPNGFWKGLIYNNIFSSNIMFSGPSPNGFDLIHFKMLGNLFKSFPTFSQIDTTGSFQNTTYTSIKFKDTANLDFTYDDTESRLGNAYTTNYPIVDDVNGTPRPNPLGTNPEVGAFESKKSASMPNSPSLSAPVANDKRVTLSWSDSNVSGIVKYRIYKDSVSIAGSGASNFNNGLIAYFPFTGNILDSSGKGNQLVNTNATASTDRFNNNNMSYTFNGTNAYLQSSTLSEEVTNKSFSAWVKLSNTSQTGGGVIGIQNSNSSVFDAIVYNETNQGWGFGSNNFDRTKWSGISEASTTNWVHIAATYEANLYRLYRNGVLFDSVKNYTITRFPVNSKINIGIRHNGGANAFLAGGIDDVRVYNRSLSPSEMLNLYNYELKNYTERNANTIAVGHYKEINSSSRSYVDDVYDYKKYYYRVTAVNANGVESDFSNEVSITPQSAADLKQVCVGATLTLASNSTTTWTQVGAPVVRAMNAGWSATLAGTDPAKKYKLVVSGTWGIANGVRHRDAAYASSSSSVAITAVGSNPVANRGCDANWLFQGACPPPVPASPAGYAANNTYEYLIGNGRVGGFAIAFSDGNYGDNSGSLTFTLYESAASATTTLLSTTTQAMTAGWSTNLSATDPTKKYKLVVSGTWGIANGVRHRDAAYTSSSSSVAITAVGSNPVANRGCDANWLFEGACPPPVPSSPSTYASNNTYEYIIGNGKFGGYNISFSDGNYGDNAGSLTFQLYEFTDGIWSSSDPSIATVNSSGDVTGIAAGTARILYTTSSGSGNSSDIQLINVNALPEAPTVTAGGWRLLSSNTQAMTTGWTQNLSASASKKYKLVVSGTWGIANGVRHRDAAYTSSSSSIAITSVGSNPVPNRGCDANWRLNGACPPPVPSSPSSYATNNTYEYILGNGSSNGFTIAFSDVNYGDNSGSLTFDYYELIETPVNKICENSGATLVPNPLAGHSMRWYTTATGGTASGILPTISTSAPNTSTFYATQVNDVSSCESPRQVVTAIVNANPAAPVVPSNGLVLYQNANSSTLKVDTLAGNSAFWYTSLNGIGSSTAPVVSTSAVGTTNYYVSQISNSTNCESTKATYTVIVNALPTRPTTMLPNNNQAKVDTLVKFIWNRAAGVTNYKLTIATDSNLLTKIIDSVIVDTQFVYNRPLNTNTNYYWSVQIKDANRFVDWSNRYNFQTLVASPVAKSVAAVSNINNLVWQASDTAKLNAIKVYRDTLPFNAGVEMDSILLKGLVAYYGFNSNANDSSSFKNNATVTGAALVADRFGVERSAYEFNGTSNYITVPGNTNNDLTANYTISMWVYAPSGLRGGQILGKWGIGGARNASYGLAINSTGILTITNNDGINNYGLVSSRAITLDSWHHLVIKYSGDTLSIFNDNSLLDSKTGIRRAQASRYNLDIGWEAYGRYQYFKGKLDDIRLYSRALSDTEISRLYTYENIIPTSRTSTNNDTTKLIKTLSNRITTVNDTVSSFNTYYYRVAAVNKNNIESALSNELNIINYTQPVLTLPLNNAIGVAQTPTLSWTNNNRNFNGNHRIQLSTDSTFTGLMFLDTTLSASSLAIKKALSTNTRYYWRVLATRNSSLSAWSVRNSFITNLPVPNFISLNGGNKIDTLKWSYSDTTIIKQFNIYRDTLEAPTKLLDIVASNLTSYIDSVNLLLNTRYFYRIVAIDKNGNQSDFSSTKQIILVNKKPIAAKFVDKRINNAGEFNFVKYSFDASSSIDPDGKITDYAWYVNDSLVASKQAILDYTFRQGTNEVKLVVTDNDKDKDSAYVDLSITSFVKQFPGGFLAGITAVSPNVIYTSDSSFNSTTGASVYLLNRSGEITYPLVVSSKVYTTPSVASDSSVFITSGSNLYGFSKSGAPLWSIIPLGGNSFVTPTIDSIQQRLYVGVSNKNFFAVNYKTGKIEWNVMSDAPINTSAVITGDRKLVFTSESGTLYGFDIFTNAIQTVPKWKISFGDIVTKAPAIDATNNIYIGTNTGRLIKLKLNDAGTVSVLWNVTLPSPIQSSPVIDADGFVYVGQNSGDFSKINPTNGELIWTFNTSSTINSAPFINEYGTIYIANESGYVYAIDANKNIKWMYKDEDGIVANILYVKGMLYFGSLSGAYTAIFDDPNSVAINTNLTTTVSAGKVNQSIKTLNTTSIPVREPIWGTFQGNYKRNGAKPLDCPPKPTIRSLNNGLFSFCESSSLPIRYSDTTINFVWKYQDTLLTESKTRTLNVTKPGQYSVAVTNVYGCTTSSDLVTVSKIPIPATPNIIRAQNGNLLSNYNSGNKWYKDNILLTDTTSFLAPKGVGNYSLQTSQNGCISQMSTSYYYVVTNVVQLENGQYINLNPNPFINRLIINFNINKNPSLNADVIDFATGRLITSRKNVFTNTDLNLANINAGIYLIKVYSNDLKVNVTFKIVKL